MSKIQYLEAGIEGANSDRTETQVFKAAAAVTAGDWLQFDLSQTGADKMLYVLQAVATANGNTTIAGVALNSAAAGERVEVVVRGYVASAAVTTGVGPGRALVVDTTAGRGDVAHATDLVSPCGVALTLAAANVAEVYVNRNF